MASSRSGAGGKIVTNRRQQRLATTPYDRPPPPSSPTPLPNKTNWLTGLIIPSARALASGAGKIVSTIFSESESSSSEDEDGVSNDGTDSDNAYEIPDEGVSALNEENEIVQHGQEFQLRVRKTETKRIIEQLIMQETFSREEYDRFVNVLNSRVMNRSMESGKESLLVGSRGKTVDHEDVDIYDKAVLEAKKWFEEKKVGSSSVTELAHQTFDVNSTGFELVENEGGSPVDVARSYMKDRPLWASPTENLDLRTPLTATMKLFKEGTSNLVGHDSVSLSKKQSSFSSGSWNIQDELRRVRSKATEDMLRTPSAKIDPSWFSVAPSQQDSAGAGKVSSTMSKRTTETESFRNSKPLEGLVDAEVISDPVLAASKSRQDDKPSKAPSSKPATSFSGNIEHVITSVKNSEAVQIDGEPAANAFPNLFSTNHHEHHHHTGPNAVKIDGPPVTETTEHGGKRSSNGPSSSHESFPAGVVTWENQEHNNEGNNHNVETEKVDNTTNVEYHCELLSEAFMEVPVVAETNSIASGSKNLVVEHDELLIDMVQPSKEGNADPVAEKQQGRKLAKSNRRGRGRGRGK